MSTHKRIPQYDDDDHYLNMGVFLFVGRFRIFEHQ